MDMELLVLMRVNLQKATVLIANQDIIKNNKIMNVNYVLHNTKHVKMNKKEFNAKDKIEKDQKKNANVLLVTFKIIMIQVQFFVYIYINYI